MEEDIVKFRIQKKKPIPFDFVLDVLEELDPVTRPMFGCTAVYVGSKIVLILREKGKPAEDDGVWVATVREHHESLRAEVPTLRDISIFGPGPTGWQNLPAHEPTFEESVQRVCELIIQGDHRVGKIPKKKTKRILKTPPKKKRR